MHRVGNLREHIGAGFPELNAEDRCDGLLNHVNVVDNQPAQPNTYYSADYTNHRTEQDKQPRHGSAGHAATLKHTDILASGHHDQVKNAEYQQDYPHTDQSEDKQQYIHLLPVFSDELGIQPFRRSVARLPAPGGHDVSKWPMLLSATETWYAKPDAGKWLVSPADADPVAPMDAWADDMVLAEGLARYQEFVTEEVTRIEGNWAGLRSFAPDRTPVVGFDPVAKGFFWLAGQGGYGVQTSPALSVLAAELLAGRVPAFDVDIIAGLSPARKM